MKKKLSIALSILLLCQIFLPLQSVAANLVSQEIIGPGAVRYLYQVKGKRGRVRVNVVKCDLNNANLEVSLVTGAGKYTQKATVSQMSKRTDSIALVNGDFFNTLAQGAPLGASVLNSRVVSAPMNSVGFYSLGIDANNKAHIEEITFGGRLYAKNGKSYPIQGLNKAQYFDNIGGTDSHANTIHLYNDHWASVSRGKFKSGGVEVLLNENNVVERISNGSPLKMPVPQGKMIVQANNGAANFIRENVKPGDKLKLDYTIYPKYAWKTLIGGHGLLVAGGAAIPYRLSPESIDGYRPRTAGGISKDGKTLYLVSVEKSSRSAGMLLSELSNFMVNLGAYRAVNFDGGGSTAMTIKELGNFDQTVVTRPSGKGQRPVVNGVGVFNRAKEGPLANIKIQGPTEVLLGERASYSIKGWDQNYLPKHTEEMKQAYYLGGQWIPTNTISPKTLGTTTVGGNINGIRDTMEVKVLGSKGLKSLNLKLGKDTLGPGMTTSLSLEAVKKDGTKVSLDPSVATFKLEGFTGVVNPGQKTLTIADTQGKGLGRLLVQYDQTSLDIPLFNKDYKRIDMVIGHKSYTRDGEKLTMDVAPFATNNRTLVPLRFLVESLGGQVEWVQESQEVHIAYKGHQLVLPLNSTTMTVDGKSVKIDTPAMVKKERTFVPIRFVVENLGLEVGYDQASKRVTILEKQEILKEKEQMPEENKVLEKNSLEKPQEAKENPLREDQAA